MSKQIRLAVIIFPLLFLCLEAKAHDPVNRAALESNANARIGTLAAMIGTVKVQIRNSTGWVTAKKGMILYEGARIRTLEDSFAAIILKNGSAIRLNEMSNLLFISGKNNDSKQRMKMVLGRLWAKVTKQINSLEIETPSAIAKIKGTEFEVRVDRSGASELLVREGVVRFYNNKGEVLVSASQQSRSTFDQPPEKARKVDLGKFQSWYEVLQEKPRQIQSTKSGLEEQGGIKVNQSKQKPAITRSKVSITNIRKFGRAKTIVAGENANAAIGEVTIRNSTIDGKISNYTDISESGNMATGKDSEVKAGTITGE